MIRQSFDHGLPGHLRLFQKILGNLPHPGLGSQSIGKGNCLHRYEIHHTLEGVLHPDGYLQSHGRSSEFFLYVPHHHVEISADTFHLIHKSDSGNPITICLTPNGFRLGLHSTHSAKDSHGTVKHPHRPLHLYRKVHVAGRINNVDEAIPPFTSSSGRSNGNTPLPLLLHPVHGGSTFMNLAHLVVSPRVVQDALGGGGFPGIDMSCYAYISNMLKRRCLRHVSITIQNF